MKRTSTALLLLLLLAVAGLGPVSAQPGLSEVIDSHGARAAERPHAPRVLTDLGNLLVLAGEMVEAEETYRRALEIDETQVTARYNLGLLLHQTGRRRLAHRQQTRVVKIRPDHAWAHYQLGTLAAEAGDRARAIRHYATAFSLNRRLTQEEFNPHLLDNELAIPAVMRAYGASSSAALAPRQYEEPGRITELLVPALAEIEGEEMPAEVPEQEVGETETGETMEAGATPEGDAAEEAGGAADPGPMETITGAESRDAPAPEDQEDEEDEGAATSAEELREALSRRRDSRRQRVTTPTPPPPAGPSTRPSPSPAPDRTIAPPPTGPRPPGAGRERFRPGVSSTGRLGLRLMPPPSASGSARG